MDCLWCICQGCLCYYDITFPGTRDSLFFVGRRSYIEWVSLFWWDPHAASARKLGFERIFFPVAQWRRDWVCPGPRNLFNSTIYIFNIFQAKISQSWPHRDTLLTQGWGDFILEWTRHAAWVFDILQWSSYFLQYWELYMSSSFERIAMFGINRRRYVISMRVQFLEFIIY